MWKVLIEILSKLACRHVWKKITTIKIINDDNIPVGYKFYLECEKCGKIKKLED